MILEIVKKCKVVETFTSFDISRVNGNGRSVFVVLVLEVGDLNVEDLGNHLTEDDSVLLYTTICDPVVGSSLVKVVITSAKQKSEISVAVADIENVEDIDDTDGPSVQSVRK